MDATSSTSPSLRTLTSVAFDRLRADIIAGVLQPQERLRIQALSERYEVGASAIREALSRLVTDGLVASEDQRGFFVCPVSREELTDLTETRIRLEQSALRMAIANGDVEWETSVLASYHRMSRMAQPAEPGTDAPWAMAHRQFHRALIDGCGSAWTLRLCSLLYDQSERYRNLAARVGGSKRRHAPDEHRKLMDVALARDADAACAMIREHFELTSRVILASGIVSDPQRESSRRKAA